MSRLRTSSLALLALIAGPAAAADLPAEPVYKAPATAVTAQSGAFYVWVDGSYQSINLPTFDLGQRIFPNGAVAGFSGPGNAITTFDPRVSGPGVSGALGYVLPNGTLAPVFGSNVRVEIGGSYVRASATQFGTGTFPANARFGDALAFLNGTNAANGTGPEPVAIPVNATLSTDYAAWSINGKVASDFRSGMFTATPSLTFFAGRASNDQDFDQQVLVPTVPMFFPGNVQEYKAQSNLAWTDAGAKAGLNLTADLTNWLALGVGGTVGLANREASLSGNDRFTISTFVPPLLGTSTISTSANATPFLASAEASITLRPLAAVLVRGFAGLSYDSAVPGIAAPQFVGTGGFNPVPTPAGIKFQHETSYYAGGGVLVRFGP